MRLLKILRSNRGSGTPLIIAVCLVLLLLFCVISEYARINIIVSGVRDAVQQAVISTANDNYDDVYHSVREGYAAGFMPSEDDWQESLDYGNIYGELARTLGLVEENGSFSKYSGSAKEFTLSKLEVKVQNNALASGEREDFVADVRLSLSVPLRFGGKLLPTIDIALRTQAKYVPLF